ncbi:MAG: PEP-CTERM sorting domain-containing protein [Syntrophales bacterium]
MLGGGNGNPGIEITGSIRLVPEPTTILLIGLGLIGLAGVRRKID